MNKIRMILTWGLLLAVTHVMGYTISVEPIVVEPGGSTDLIINLSNTETNLTAYQLSLFLPEGVTVQKKSNGKYAYTANADRHDGNFTITVKDAANGSILIACFSADKDVLTGSSGELIRLPIEVASTVTTSQQGSLGNIEFTDVNAQAYRIADVEFTISVEETPPTPEVTVSLPDVEVTSGGTANLIVNMETERTDLTAYQLSLFLPEGVTVQKKSNGKYAYTANADRHDGNFTFTVKDAANGSILIACFSADKDVLTGSSGELIRLPLEVASTVATSLQGSLSNIEFTDVNAQAYHPAGVTITFNYGTNTPVLATGISLNQSSFTLTAAGQTETLTATVTPSNASNKNVTWTSSNTAVATVSDAGVVTAVANGTATITATTADGTNLTAECTVNVNIPVPATGITLSQTELTLTAAGQTETLTATVTPSNASNKNVTWTSSNTAVATVSDAGVVTAVANGTATITATTADGTNLTAECAVTVNISVPSTVTVSVADVAITPGGSANLIINMETSLSNLTAYQMSLYLPAGITVQKKSNGKYAFTANADRHDGNFTISVKDAADGSILITCFSADKDVLTGSSGELIRLPLDVASTVSSSLQGSLNNIEFTDVNAQAYHPAEVTITFNYGTNTPVLATGISLNQSSFTLTEVGQTETLSATVTPSNATNKSVTWSSSNTAVATVSSAGVVTAVANGTAIITATTADGTNLSATCAVTVSITGDEPSEIEVTDISQLDNAVYIVPFTGRVGEQVQLVVNLKNAEEVSAYIFELELPDGVTVATNSNGKYIDALSDRHDDHSRTINYKGNNVYALSALSTNSEVLTGNDGPIRYLTLLVADDMEEGVYAINIRNASFSRPNGSLVEMENTTSTITIEDYLLGDVNGNNGIDIADAVCIVNYLVGKPNQIFIEKAADTNKNGKTDIGDAVTIVNYLVGKTESLAPQLILEENATNQRDPD